MASVVPPSGATGQEINQENWMEVTAYVRRLGTELQQFKTELEETKKHLTAAKATVSGTTSAAAKPNKPAMFSGKVGTIDSWCAHMESYLT